LSQCRPPFPGDAQLDIYTMAVFDDISGNLIQLVEMIEGR
jgi:hypothetical protein